MVSLLGTIHQRWAAAAPLSGLLPASRVYTGSSVAPAPPLALIKKESDRPLATYNDGSATAAVAVQIEVYHASYDAAAAIVEQVRAAFDNAAFDLGDGDRVIHMRRTNGAEEQTPDGVWQITTEFECIVLQSRQ